MWDMEPRKILVAVDSDCDSALQYAVAEALRRGCGIHVTRVDRPAIWSSYVLDEVSLVEGELPASGCIHPGGCRGQGRGDFWTTRPRTTNGCR